MTYELNLIPRSHWPTRPAWTVVASREEFGGDRPLLSMSARHGVRLRAEGEGRAASEDLSGYRVVKPGDLVVNRLSARDGAYGVSRWEGLVSPAYWVLRADPGMDSRWLDYVLRSSPYAAELARISKFMPPAQFDLPWDQFRRLQIPMPPLDEQRAIADYLDAETDRIDALIEKKQRMVDLLDERTKSIVASTCPGEIVHGRDGKPKGLSGLRCVRLGALSVIQSGLTLDQKREAGVDSVTAPYLRVANVQDGSLNLNELKVVTVPSALASRCSLRPGDVLMTEGGDPDKLGRGTVWPGDISPCLHQNHVFAVRPSEHLLPEYLALITRTPYARAYFEMTASKTTGIASTSTSKIASFRVPLPPIERQLKIVAVARNELAQVNDLEAAISAQIDFLTERRQSLITAAVTGELKIKEAA